MQTLVNELGDIDLVEFVLVSNGLHLGGCQETETGVEKKRQQDLYAFLKRG